MKSGEGRCYHHEQSEGSDYKNSLFNRDYMVAVVLDLSQFVSVLWQLVLTILKLQFPAQGDLGLSEGNAQA